MAADAIVYERWLASTERNLEHRKANRPRLTNIARKGWATRRSA
jgi:hypothetical protein